MREIYRRIFQVVADGSLNGLLAWYSLVHLDPEELPVILSDVARALAPQGHLLVGFFDGPSAEQFEHAITTAYYWSVDQMGEMLHSKSWTLKRVRTPANGHTQQSPRLPGEDPLEVTVPG